ncbi:IS110 family transposase [Deferribacter autotrophicus]|uniref:IS110 family transposase n=1 Tax=Deferribacter autotrophicus TaxID=500465 RepID=A0A5A8F786_9BACT|nr:IS110 family transposase [Deferribacter autotrophicus]KAA0257072.1 IS110 family transposase [Deferribacter autotrophicus]KAA0257393.1 IS110 family transposase [Deferribacter autotrophicus]KAA0258543.1 IS110 family transposase [Deferribacter autotrophicus]KAA0258599.1 IS110 family transposase [Deferribacter autotrophicus]KAA0258610.1 IS110 family transposase [Deferribacter autotrophicus]
MRRFENVVGIDVSKSTLSISFYDGSTHKYYETSNSVRSFTKDFLKKVKGVDWSKVLFMMESTGVYHLKLATHLSRELGYEVSVANPMSIKKYSDMNLRKAKTDKSDSKLIAEYGLEYGYKWRFKPKDELYYEIDSRLKAIEDFQSQINRLNNQIEGFSQLPYEQEEVISCYKDVISAYKSKIKKLEQELEVLLKSRYREEYELVMSIPGVGMKLASIVLGKLECFRNFKRAKEVVSYIGLCPSIRESGTSVRGRGHISRRGNAYIRKILFVCSLSAIRYNKFCSNLYRRLLSSGKAKKLAIIAVANKLIRQIFGVLKNGRPYDPEYLKNLTEVTENG